jgi:hypothetical protein
MQTRPCMLVRLHMHAVVNPCAYWYHLMPADVRLVSADAHAGGDRYVRGDRICMCPIPTPAKVAT